MSNKNGWPGRRVVLWALLLLMSALYGLAPVLSRRVEIRRTCPACRKRRRWNSARATRHMPLRASGRRTRASRACRSPATACGVCTRVPRGRWRGARRTGFRRSYGGYVRGRRRRAFRGGQAACRGGTKAARDAFRRPGRLPHQGQPRAERRHRVMKRTRAARIRFPCAQWSARPGKKRRWGLQYLQKI